MFRILRLTESGVIKKNLVHDSLGDTVKEEFFKRSLYCSIGIRGMDNRLVVFLSLVGQKTSLFSHTTGATNLKK